MSQLATLKQTLSGPAMREQFARALPKHLSPERFCRIAITALTRTPKLAECTQESLMKCLLDLSAFGLEPDGRRAHLIPYGNQCTLVIDWKGLAELAMRSGIIAKLHADIVCENDEFEFNLGEVTRHKIDFRKPRGEMYAAYALAQTKTGEVFACVLSKDEVDAVRKRSRSGTSGPWVSDYNEMAKKTAFRRLSKWLPLSAEFRDAQERDEEEFQERDVTPKAESSPLFKNLAAKSPQTTGSPASQRDGSQASQNEPVESFQEVNLIDSPAVSLADQIKAKLDTSKLKWSDVLTKLQESGIGGEEFTPLELTDDDTLKSALELWSGIAQALTKGGK